MIKKLTAQVKWLWVFLLRHLVRDHNEAIKMSEENRQGLKQQIMDLSPGRVFE